MECRRTRLNRQYGAEFVQIITGGYIPCGFCKRIHTPDENIIEIKEDEVHEKQTVVS